MAFDGSSLRNISSDTQNKDRVNKYIREFYERAKIGSGTEFFAEYDGAEKEYHQLCLTRNSDEDEILQHRHLVYQVDLDAWYEIQIKDSSGDREYETSIALITDDKGRDILVNSTISGTDGTTGHFNQMNYDPETDYLDGETLIASQSAPDPDMVRCNGTVVDSDDNIYVSSYGDGTTGGNIYKITKTGTASTLCSQTEIKSAITGETDELNLYGLIIDNENDYLYFLAIDEGAAAEHTYIMQSDLSGSLTQIASVTTDGTNNFDHMRLAVDSEGSIYYSKNVSGTQGRIVKILDPGGGGESTSNYYTSTAGTSIVGELYMDSDDNLFFAEKTGSTYGMCKLTDVTGTQDYDELFTTAYPIGKMVSADSSTIYFASTAFYWNWGDDEDTWEGGAMYKATLSDSTWTVTAMTSVVGDYTGNTEDMLDTMDVVTDFALDNNGDIVVFTNDASNYLSYAYRIYPDREYVAYSASADGSSTSTNAGILGISISSDNWINLCAYGFDGIEGVFRYTDYKYCEFADINDDDGTGSQSWTKDSEVYLQTTYYDMGSLGIEKSVPRVYFETESKNVNCGFLYSQTDYDKNRAIHISGESSKPDTSHYGYSWVDMGEQQWNTNNWFDDDSGTVTPTEHRERHEINMFLKGNRVRFALRGGTHKSSRNGKLRIGVPTLLARVKGQSSE